MADGAGRCGSRIPNFARRMSIGRIRLLSEEHPAPICGEVLCVSWSSDAEEQLSVGSAPNRLCRRDHGTPPIVSGSPTSSPLFKYVSDEAEPMAMPPKGSPQKRMTPTEISLLKEWIEQGAQWPEEETSTERDPMDWWSFRPLKQPKFRSAISIPSMPSFEGVGCKGACSFASRGPTHVGSTPLL